jgi:hypothetical protein
MPRWNVDEVLPWIGREGNTRARLWLLITIAIGMSLTSVAMSSPVSQGTPPDFNGDHKTDLLWRDPTNLTISIWEMNGGQVIAEVPVTVNAPVSNTLNIVATGDFNGDGNSDIVWRNINTGALAIWLMNGAQVTSGAWLPVTGLTDWVVLGAGDFNGDGKSDILLQNTVTGQLAVWFMNGLQIVSGLYLPSPPSGSVIAGIGDFNGDGKSDILWQNTANGTVQLWLMNGAQVAADIPLPVTGSLNDWLVVGVGDFNGDGTSDILWRNTATGEMAVWLLRGGQISSGLDLPSEPTNSVVAAIGDFNGDGTSDIMWEDQLTGSLTIWQMNNGQMEATLPVGTAPSNTALSVGNDPLSPTSPSSGGSESAIIGSLFPADSNASANWQMAGMLSVGGIPNRTTVCATVRPKGSGADDTTDIQNAVNACPLGQVVSLSAGTFTIAEGNYVLLNKGISLRGAGPSSTILTRTGGATLNSDNPGSNPSPMIILGPMEYSNNETATTLTGDGAQGAYSVQVASTAGFSVGQIVLLDEASGAGWQPDVIWTNMQIWASSDYRVVWQKHNPNDQYVDDFSATQYPYQAGTAGCWFSNCDRPTNEMHRITAISGNTITFDSPLTISYRVSHQAQLYYFQTPLTENAGVENLTVQYGDADSIDFDWCAYCWAQNVENTLWLGDAFGINNSFRVQLEEVYIHNGAWPVNGGGGYNISIANGSSEVLVENSISVLTNKVIVDRSSGAGSVVAYNYMDDGYINGSDTWVEIGLNGSHMVGGHHVLFEGNQSFNADSDQTHGNSIYHTFFRNWLTAFRKPFTALDGTAVNDATQESTNGPLRAAGAHAYAYGFSFIGNVLGTAGQMNGWTYNCIASPNNIPSKCIWELGWMDITPQGYDPNVAATAIQDGNFDYLTNTINWATSDTAHTLPNSLYLTQEPAFFNAGKGYTWPWVNPTGSPQLYTLPAKARYDAGTPFTQP